MTIGASVYQRTGRALHRHVKSLLTVLICLILSAPSFAHPTESALSILVPSRMQEITYNSLDRPSELEEGGKTAAFTYNAAGDRVKLQVANGITQELTRYYIGGQYEYDSTSAGTKERLYLGGDAYSAPMVLQRVNNGSWTAYNIGRDYLGNITHIATADGTLVAEYSYDPWGRLRTPNTHSIYTPGNEPTLFLGRGFTGHEHLTWFGLINMNARLYDPLLGRFLSSDPYVQAPDFTQNFNRYSYALNNPLRYSDESGEYWHIVIGAIVGGVGNLVGNWKNCSGFWDYFASFGIGAAAGAAIAATGGAAAAAGGGAWATAGVIAVGATGGAATGATNEIIRQTGPNFSGIEAVDWTSVGVSAAVSGVVGGVGAGVGIAMSGVNVPINVNGTTVSSPALNSFIAGSVSSGVAHIAGGTAAGLITGHPFLESFESSLDGLLSSMLMGGAFSVASTTAYEITNGRNPFYIKQSTDNQTVTAKDLGLEAEVARIKSGDLYTRYRHDGSNFMNYEGYLPSGVIYTEYVVPPSSGFGPGAARIVVGSDGFWYYTPDHYQTFFRFKP